MSDCRQWSKMNVRFPLFRVISLEGSHLTFDIGHNWTFVILSYVKYVKCQINRSNVCELARMGMTMTDDFSASVPALRMLDMQLRSK